MVGNIEPSGPGLWLANFSGGLQTDLELAEPKQVEANAGELQVLQGVPGIQCDRIRVPVHPISRGLFLV